MNRTKIRNGRLMLVTALFLVCAFSISSCEKEITDKKPIGPQFSLDKFESELKASIEPSGAIGWTYIISQNGLYARGGAFGKARNTADGNINMSIHKKINIASVSKFLTAIAVMQLLERRGLTTESNIAQWLPPNWNNGPGVANLKFSDLLGHTSGLSSVNTRFTTTLGYAGLRRMIDTGAIRSTVYTYLNANFALFRVLIPSLWKGLDDAPSMGQIDSLTSQNVYIQYMQEHVFKPIGLNNITCLPEDRSIATMYYATTDLDNVNGTFYNDWTAICGGGGYFMTTFELATVVAYYQHTEVLLSKESRTIMRDNRFGMDRQDGSYEKHGTYFGKNGSIASAIGQGTFEQIVMFPNGIEAVVMFNTQGMTFAGGERTLSRAIFDAYNKSWQ